MTPRQYTRASVTKMLTRAFWINIAASGINGAVCLLNRHGWLTWLNAALMITSFACALLMRYRLKQVERLPHD